MLLRGAFGHGTWGFYSVADHVTRDRQWLWRISEYGTLVRYAMDNLEDELVSRVCGDRARVRGALFDEGPSLAAFAWVQLASNAFRAERWNIDGPHVERVVLRELASPGEGPYDLVRSACGNFAMFSAWTDGHLYSMTREPTSRLVNVVRAEFIDDSGGRQTLAIDADRVVTFERGGLAILGRDGRQTGSIAVLSGRANSLSPLGAMKVALVDYDWGFTADFAAVDLATGAVTSLGEGQSVGRWLFEDRVYVVRNTDEQAAGVEVFSFDGSAVETRAYGGHEISQALGASLYSVSSDGVYEYDARTLTLVSSLRVEEPIRELYCDEDANVVVARRGERLVLHSARTAERICECAFDGQVPSTIGFCDGGSTLLALEGRASGGVAIAEYAVSSGGLERRWESASIELEGFRVSDTRMLASVDRAVLLPLRRDSTDERGAWRGEQRRVIAKRITGEASLPIDWTAYGELAVCSIDASVQECAVALRRSDDPAVWCAIDVVSTRDGAEQECVWRSVEWLVDGTRRERFVASFAREEWSSCFFVDEGVVRATSDGAPPRYALVRRDGTTTSWAEDRGASRWLRGSCNGRVKLLGALVARTLVLRHPDGTIVGRITCDDPLDEPWSFALDERCATCAVATARGRLLVYSLDRVKLGLESGLGTVL